MPEKIAVALTKARVEGEALYQEPLPELTELQKSEKPINEELGVKKKIEIIQSWNNYTIILLEESPDIKIFDEDMKLIEDFKPPLNSKKVSVDWMQSYVRSKLGGYKYICSETNNNPSSLKISKIPFELRAFAKKSLKGNSIFVLFEQQQPVEFSASNLTVLLDKYVVLTTKEGAFFAFVTKTDKGVILAPKDWKRLDPSSPIPQELSKEVEKLLGENEGYKQINESYYALITDVGINIFKMGDAQGSPVFSESIPSVEKNITINPSNPNVIYYCQSSNPRSIARLDVSGEPNTWESVVAEFPQKYESVHNLQLDPTGNFFLFYSKEALVIVTKDGLEEVKRAPNLTQVNFDVTGRIRAVDKDGYLVIYEPNFSEVAQELDKRRVAKLAEGIQIQNIFDLQTSKKDEKVEEILERLEPLRAKYQEQFGEVLAKITTQEGVLQLRQGFNKLRDQLRQHGLKPNEVAFIIKGLETPIVEKEKEFAVKETQDALTSVRAKLAGSLSIILISEARAEVDKIKAVEVLLEGDLRQEFRQVVQEFEQRSLEFFHQRGGEVIKDVQGLLSRTKTDLEAFTSKTQMDDWLEFRYPRLKSRLGSLAHDIPLEADEAYKAIMGARTELQELATEFEEKFKREYAKVREKAVERVEATVDILETDIEGLINRLRSKGFADRGIAEQYLNSSEARKTLEAEITALAGNNPDVAKELDRALKVRLSNALTEIERGGMTHVAETGQQMILFGKTSFPKWEAKAKERGERKIDLVFNEDGKTHGLGVKVGDILGDISVNIRTSTGKVENVRLFEGWQDENEWRLGLLTYRGESIPPSYVTATDYKTIKKEYSDWSLGERSKLQKELKEKRDDLKEIYSQRQKINERTPDVDDAWSEEYKAKFQEYATFIAEHHIPLLKRIEQIKDEPEVEYTNGKGYVPEWQSHWVNDPQTEKDLEEMAKTFKMQLDLQEGILNLKGHAGTGKDVRLKMFAVLTNRLYFATDCTKWTTEFELSEDVVLQGEKGTIMPQTVRVPCYILLPSLIY
ncbi:MAG: hypothetical protein V1649_00305 [Patescibacteria group bacterium]